MGWKPADVYGVGVLEFAAAWEGWAKVHCTTPEKPMTQGDLQRLIAEHG